MASTIEKLAARGPRAALATFLIAMVCAQPAFGLNIVLNYDAGGSAPPGSDPGGVLLQTVIAPAAELLWERIILDPGTVTITYRYKDIAGLMNGTAVSVVDGHPVTGTINVDIDDPWWFDSTPLNNSEYDFNQVLYRDLAPATQTLWYNGAPPPVLEASYRGFVNASAPVLAGSGFDIFSSFVHEIGHVLGLSHSAMAKAETVDEGDWDFDFNPAFIGGVSAAVKTAGFDPDNVNDWAHIAAVALMCKSCAQTGLRRMPGATDVFAIASGANWSNILLQRSDDGVHRRFAHLVRLSLAAGDLSLNNAKQLANIRHSGEIQAGVVGLNQPPALS